jgi:release factor glutamine methyltransferase
MSSLYISFNAEFGVLQQSRAVDATADRDDKRIIFCDKLRDFARFSQFYQVVLFNFLSLNLQDRNKKISAMPNENINWMWPASNTVAQVRKHIHQMLMETFPDEQERNVLASMILQYITGLGKAEIAIQPDFRVNESDIVWLKNALEDLNDHCPVQYVVGYEEFYGLKFNVNKHVLIPRPETEELVKWVLDDHAASKSPLSVIDFGTGSGCIAVSLKHNRTDWSVCGIDKSVEAIAVAQSNALQNGVEVDFAENDLLDFKPMSQKFDLVVSNPPYIRNSEKGLMQKNVLEFEPEMALFVEDNDPLVFYRAIAEISKTLLNNQGCIYLEINEALGSETVQMLKDLGFSDVELKEDLFGKPRMVKARKS